MACANLGTAHGYYLCNQMSSLSCHPSLATAPLTGAVVAGSTEPTGLLERLRARDETALSQITRHYGPAMTRAAYLHLGDIHAAEDAAQEALIAAWDGAYRTGEATTLWPWLLGITLNRCRKHLRSLSRRRRRELHAHALHQAHVDAACNAHMGDRADQLRMALLNLPEPLRCVIILRYEQGLSIAQTADAMQLPQGTVKRRCHDAIGKLREQMRGQS